MKKLELEFKSNADQTGLQTFKQIKRTADVALYQRVTKDGRTFAYEVFVVKVIKAGTVFAKGAAPTKEDQESYPGKAAFGRYAYCCKTLERAEQFFDELVKRVNDKNALVESEETVDSDGNFVDVSGKSKRGRKSKNIKMPIPKKGEKFTMKNLMAWSGESQPNLYNRLKVLIEAAMVGIAGEVREAHTRGKAQILYISNTDDFANDLPVAN